MRKVTAAGAVALVAMVGITGNATAASRTTAAPSVSVRPGMVINITLPAFENSCSAGFLFRGKSPTAPRRSVNYLATAGHCLLTDENATEEVHRTGLGPVVTRTALSAQGTAVPGPRLGRVVYVASTVPVQYPDPNLPEFMDLGLIQLDDEVVPDPAMCFFGGPTGMRTNALDVPEPLRFYGAGNFTGFNRETGRTVLPGRTAFGSTAAHPHVVVGAFAGSNGDSGSPIIDGAGRAVASLTGPYQPRLDLMIPRVEKMLGIKLELRTAPLRAGAAAAGTDPGCAPLAAAGSARSGG